MLHVDSSYTPYRNLNFYTKNFFWGLVFFICFWWIGGNLLVWVYCAEAEPLKMAGGAPSGSAKPNSTAGF